MHWLHYAFFGLMFALGAIVFVLHLRAKQGRAWIWALVALVGAAGLVGVVTGRADGSWRTLAMSAVFLLFATDHLVQYGQTRRAGAPKKIQIYLALGWLVLGVFQAIDFG